MASGRWHNRANFVLTAATFGGALYLGAGLDVAAQLAGGVAIGFVINPDLDVDKGAIAFHNVRRTAGRLPAFLWRVFWWPYAKVVPHRSKVSHAPILGTLVRIGYMAALLWPVTVWALGWVAPLVLAWVVVGLCLSDIGHWVMDGGARG